jgi:hypothetical protein
MSMVCNVSVTLLIGTKLVDKTAYVPAAVISGKLPGLEEIQRDEVRRYLDVDPKFAVMATISDPFDPSENVAFLVG